MIDLVGRKFGRLTVVSEAERTRSKGGTSIRMWNCVCDCGNKRTLSSSALTGCKTKSCGCYKKDVNKKRFTKHGLSKTKLYRVWSSIKDRCYRDGCKGYINYGGRGIVMCDEWKNNFQAFYDWSISNGYTEGLTIERKDVNGNYCPENCCWIPKSEQPKNRRNSHFITYKGETKTLSEWSKELHIDRETVRLYEKRFGDGEKAINTILQSKRHKPHTHRIDSKNKESEE